MWRHLQLRVYIYHQVSRTTHQTSDPLPEQIHYHRYLPPSGHPLLGRLFYSDYRCQISPLSLDNVHVYRVLPEYSNNSVGSLSRAGRGTTVEYFFPREKRYYMTTTLTFGYKVTSPLMSLKNIIWYLPLENSNI